MHRTPIVVRSLKKNILIIALVVSFVWHLFWISAVRVVTNPADIESTKFSKVFFLGPLLSRGLLDVRFAPRSPTFLEDRFDRMVMGAFTAHMLHMKEPALDAVRQEPYGGIIVKHIEQQMADKKTEPDFGFEKR